MMISYIFIVPQRGLLRNANKNTTIKQDNAEGDSPPRAGGGGGPWQTWARPPWKTVRRHLRWQNDDDDDDNDANADTQQSNRTTPRVTPPLARAAAAGLGGLGHALRGGLSGGTLGGKTTMTSTTTMQTLIGGQNASHPAPETNDRDDGDNGGTMSPITTTMTVMARGTNHHAEGGKDCATTRAMMD
jgi:hypothetical protein